MLMTVTGGSGSGKSEFAEKIAMDLARPEPAGKTAAGQAEREPSEDPAGKKRIYLATMMPFGQEARARILRHRKLREGKGFVTIEKPSCLTELDHEELRGATVLLEDLSNLTSNEMFLPDGSVIPPDETCRRVFDGVRYLLSCAEHLVIVQNEVFSDGKIYDEGTEQFLRTLGYLNREIASGADASYEVVYGIPISLKG